MYLEYKHVEEWGSRKLSRSGPQLASRKQKNRFIEVWNFKRNIIVLHQIFYKETSKIVNFIYDVYSSILFQPQMD